MKKEIEKLKQLLKNDTIKCYFIETVDKNWFFQEINLDESEYKQVFWNGVTTVEDDAFKLTKSRIDPKDLTLTHLLHSIVEDVDDEHSNCTTINWILDVNMFIDLKSNYNKLITYIKSINVVLSKVKIIFVDCDFSKIPTELQQQCCLIKIGVPNKVELKEIISKRINFINPDYLTTDNNMSDLIDAAIGLDRKTVNETLKNSYIEHQDFLPTAFQSVRHEYINKNNQLNSIRYDEDDIELIGLNKLKDFVIKMIKSKKGKGVLLLGVAGTGKTQFAKYVGKQTNQLVVNMDLSKMKGKYVGETEKQTVSAIDTINSIGECIVLVDEIEKGLSGVSNGGDSGASINQGATFLKWLSEKKEGGSYLIATANNIDNLPSEYKRAERWDGIFFLDLPSEDMRKKIIEYYIDYYKIDSKKNNINDIVDITNNFTGAEIKTMCRLASALSLTCKEICDEYITNIYSVDKEKIDNLRKWSVGRTVSAEYNNSISKNKPKKEIKKIKENLNDCI